VSATPHWSVVVVGVVVVVFEVGVVVIIIIILVVVALEFVTYWFTMLDVQLRVRKSNFWSDI